MENCLQQQKSNSTKKSMIICLEKIKKLFGAK